MEVIEFKNIFLKNGYPSDIIDTCIKKFLDKIFCKKLNRCTVPKKYFFIVLPYLGTLSSKIQKQIRNVFQKTMPWNKIKLTFKTHTRISHFFRFKDPIPNALVSNISCLSQCHTKPNTLGADIFGGRNLCEFRDFMALSRTFVLAKVKHFPIFDLAEVSAHESFYSCSSNHQKIFHRLKILSTRKNFVIYKRQNFNCLVLARLYEMF